MPIEAHERLLFSGAGYEADLLSSLARHVGAELSLVADVLA